MYLGRSALREPACSQQPPPASRDIHSVPKACIRHGRRLGVIPLNQDAIPLAAAAIALEVREQAFLRRWPTSGRFFGWARTGPRYHSMIPFDSGGGP
jgi:hypothetical protein